MEHAASRFHQTNYLQIMISYFTWPFTSFNSSITRLVPQAVIPSILRVCQILSNQPSCVGCDDKQTSPYINGDSQAHNLIISNLIYFNREHVMIYAISCLFLFKLISSIKLVLFQIVLGAICYYKTGLPCSVVQWITNSINQLIIWVWATLKFSKNNSRKTTKLTYECKMISKGLLEAWIKINELIFKWKRTQKNNQTLSKILDHKTMRNFPDN